MPGRTDLPDSLAGVAQRNALHIRHVSFRDDAGRLVAAIEQVLAAASVADGAGSPGLPVMLPTGEAEAKKKAQGPGGTIQPALPGSSATPSASPTPSPASPRRPDAERRGDGGGSHRPRPRRPAPRRAERIANSLPEEYAKAQALAASRRRWRPPTPTAPSASPIPSPTSTRRQRRCAAWRQRWRPPTPTAPSASPTRIT